MKNKSLAILAVAMISGCATTPALLSNDGQTSLMQADKPSPRSGKKPVIFY